MSDEQQADWLKHSDRLFLICMSKLLWIYATLVAAANCPVCSRAHFPKGTWVKQSWPFIEPLLERVQYRYPSSRSVSSAAASTA